MDYSAKVIKDSLIVSSYGPTAGENIRVTTVEITAPRVILAEVNTHRILSRNTSSSRAIPTKRLIRDFLGFVPDKFPMNGKGMQPKGFLTGWREFTARVLWKFSGKLMILMSRIMQLIGVHKEIANRIIEPWSWTTQIITSTAWENFKALRAHPDAQRQIRIVAELLIKAIEESVPAQRPIHLPYIHDLSIDMSNNASIYAAIIKSTAKCARGSYLTQMTDFIYEQDYELHNRLLLSMPMHASPAEHIAMTFHMYRLLLPTIVKGRERPVEELNGNFKRGVVQYRKIIEPDYSEK